jgi:ribonuclease T2
MKLIFLFLLFVSILFGRYEGSAFEEVLVVPKSSSNLLALSWQNAFCQTHQYKKECKRDSLRLLKNRRYDAQFVLHGLWPQPRDNIYCQVDEALIALDKNKHWRDLPCLALDTKVENALEEVMAGYASELHKHEWIKHGTCYGTEANAYYSDAISLSNQFNHSSLARLFRDNIGQSLTLKDIRKLADKSFGSGAGKSIELRCKAGLITEVWLHLGTGEKDLGKLLRKGKKVRSNCKYGHIDKAGFGR